MLVISSKKMKNHNTNTVSIVTMSSIEKQNWTSVLYSDDKKILMSADYGEDLDDVLSFIKGILKSSNEWHIIVSSSKKMSGYDRLRILSGFIDRPLKFNQRYPDMAGGVTFYLDGDASSLATIPRCQSWVNNGPVQPYTLKRIAQVFRGASFEPCFYLVGTKNQGRTGGVNQKFCDKPWRDFIESWRGSARIIDIPSEISQHILVQLESLDEKLQHAAGQAILMFMTSRPCVPNQHGGVCTHVRLNSSNAKVNQLWLQHMKPLVARPMITHRARAKARKYVQFLRTSLNQNGHGKGDSEQAIENQLHAAGYSGRIFQRRGDDYSLSEDAWQYLETLAYIPLLFTYSIAALCGIDEPYADGKYGFKPEEKTQENPGDVFAENHYPAMMIQKFMELCPVGTPAYDLFSTKLAMIGHKQPLNSDDIDEYRRLTFSDIDASSSAVSSALAASASVDKGKRPMLFLRKSRSAPVNGTMPSNGVKRLRLA